ncbi:MAG: hypothetical protein QME94_18690 [Anaerolineae bacterium]|nr:hypothetical protein [Anaerolineae bacterium]
MTGRHRQALARRVAQWREQGYPQAEYPAMAECLKSEPALEREDTIARDQTQPIRRSVETGADGVR